ncbi:MAG TPA: flagellar export chaperone FliS [Acidobacteriaceae bacterium]
MNPAISLAYKRASVQQASTVGLVIALYDTLNGNLTRAAAALDAGDVERRCAELVHGFKVLQQLDTMLDMERGGPAAANLRRFYTHLRGQMLVAQFKLAPQILRTQAALLIELREAWQQVDSQTHAAPSPSQGGADKQLGPGAASLERAGQSLLPARFSCSG